MAQRDFFRRNSYLCDVGRAEDLALWTTAVIHERIAYLPERLYFIRETPDLDLAKYYRTIADHRKVFVRYAPVHGGRLLLAELLFRSYIAEYGYRTASLVGATASVATRRLTPISAEEAEVAQNIIDAVTGRRTEYEGRKYAEAASGR